MTKAAPSSSIKVLDLMQALTASERDRFFGWLAGDLGSVQHPVYRLAKNLAALPPGLELGSLSSSEAAATLLGQGHSPADVRRLRANMGVLVTYIEDFLVAERIRSIPALRRITLIEALTERKLGHHNQLHIDWLDAELETAQPRHPEHYQWVAKARKLRQYHALTRQTGGELPSLQEIYLPAIRAALVELMRMVHFINEFGDDQPIINSTVKFYESFIKANKQIYNSKILIFFYKKYKNIGTIKSMKYDAVNLYKQINNLIEYKKEIPSDVVEDSYISIMNYAIRYAFKSGTKEARVLLWHIHLEGLTHGFLGSYGKTLPPHRFRLFVNAAIWSGEVTRQQLLEIIQSEAMQKLLPRMKGNEALVFCEAYYDMVEGKFEDVVARLEKARFRNEFYKAESKVLILKALYERMYSGRFAIMLNDIEAVPLKVAYASRLIRELTTLSHQQRLMFLTELKLISALVRARSNYDLQRLETRLERSDMAGFNRFWFAEKIQQRKKK